MTRDEILQMKPGLGLDVLVAEKVMGWKTNWLKTDWYEEVNPNTQRHKGLVKDFKPSTNISDAWKVVEKLRERGYYVTVEMPPKAKSASHWVRVGSYYGEYVSSVHGVTIPEAVCKAALLAVMNR